MVTRASAAPLSRVGLTRKAGVAPPHGATPASSSQRWGLGELEAFAPALTLTGQVIPDQPRRILTSATRPKVKAVLKLCKRPAKVRHRGTSPAALVHRRLHFIVGRSSQMRKYFSQPQ